MRRVAFVSIFLFSTLFANPPATIEDLFVALKKSPTTLEDILKEKDAYKAMAQKEALLFPKIYGFASYEHYSNPVNVRPLTPTETMSLITTPGSTMPFSQNLQKFGARFSMPLVNTGLYAAINEAKTNVKSAEAKKNLEFISKEALLLSYDMNLKFYETLEEALISQEKSISKTSERIELGAKNGRYATSDSLKLKSIISQIDIALSDTKAKKESVIQSIYAVTGLNIANSVPLRLKKNINDESLEASLLPYKLDLKAKEYSYSASVREFYPTLSMEGSVFRGYGDAYNNDVRFQRDNGVLGVYLNVPLFDASVWQKSQKSRIAELISKNNLEKASLELEAKAKSLKSFEDELAKEIKTAQELIEANEKLLEIAKVSYKNGRMSVEEYLRYEDALFNSKASVAGIESGLWNTRGQLALIYGVELSNIVE